MSLAPEFPPQAETLADPKILLRVPVGFASPLWPLFAGAAVSGAAWWWMTRWAQPANLEAMFGAAARAEKETVAQAAALADQAVAAAGPALEPAAEAPAEPMAEAPGEPVPQALVEEPRSFEPVGGESAPISPVLEAIAPDAPEAAETPKPKKKPIAPSAD